MERQYDIEEEITKFIEEKLHRCLCAHLAVYPLIEKVGCHPCGSKEEVVGYCMELHPTGNYDRVLHLMRQGTKEEFLEYIKEELMRRHLEISKYYTVDMVYAAPRRKCEADGKGRPDNCGACN